MKNKFILVMGLIIASVFGIAAQVPADGKGFSNYVGYQFTRVDPSVRGPFNFNRGADTHGVNLASTYFFNRNVGLGAELTAARGRGDNTIVTLMAGPTVSTDRTRKVNVFVRTQAGLGYRSARPFRAFPSASDTGLAFTVGGGVDVKVGKRVAWRILQADYLQTRMFGAREDSLRLGTGFTF